MPMTLLERLQQLGPVSERQLQAVLKQGTELKLKKGEFFSRPGEPATRFAIVLEGLLRHYYVDAKGRESVKAFRGPNELSASYAEMLQAKPSRSFIQALEPATLLCFDYATFNRLADQSLELQRLARRLTEAQFVGKEQREHDFLQLSAEERYQQFVRERGDHLAHVPLHHIASYIGITPVALSRIRARLVKSRR